MIIDLNKYRKSIKPYIQDWISSRPECNVLEDIRMMALAYNCHIVAISYYCAEIVGMSEELQQYIDRTKQFYHINEILNYEPKS